MSKIRKRNLVFLRFSFAFVAFLICFVPLIGHANENGNDIHVDNSGYLEVNTDNIQAYSSFRNDIIYISDIDVVLSVNGTVNVSYSFYEPGYTLTTYYEGDWLVDNVVTSNQITLNGLHPGRTALMLYYSKRNGTTIIDEGAIIMDILVRPTEGYVHLKNVLSGKGADVAGGKAKEGAKVIIWTTNSSFQANQVWKIIPNNEGTCSIRSELGNGYYLSRNTETNRLEISTTQAFWVLQYSTVNENYMLISPNGTYYVCVEDNATTSGSYLCCSTTASSSSRKWLVQYQTAYVPVSGISITVSGGTAGSLEVGSDYELNVQVLPSNASCPEYTVSISDTDIVFVEGTNTLVAGELGTATITATTVSGVKTGTLTATVVSAPMVSHQGPIYLGLVSEDYENMSLDARRYSSTYAMDFNYYLCNHIFEDPTKDIELGLIKTSGADKRLFLQESDGGFANNVEDVDFMIFIGHGHGNNLHFAHSPDGAAHFHGTGDDKFYFSYDEARFGESGGRIKWFFAYTCNFLATGGSCVSDISELYPMLEGAHIILGGGTGMILNSQMAHIFSIQLTNGCSIINSYFNTKSTQERYYSDPCEYRVIYALEARNDTLFEYARDVKGYSEGERYGVDIISLTPRQ